MPAETMSCTSTRSQGFNSLWHSSPMAWSRQILDAFQIVQVILHMCVYTSLYKSLYVPLYACMYWTH